MPKLSATMQDSDSRRGLDWPGASASADWISFGDAQSLPYNRDAVCAQRAFAEAFSGLFAAGTAVSTNKPRGLRSVNFVMATGCVGPPVGARIPSDDYLQQLRDQLWTRLEEEPLEDGLAHPAEALVAEAIRDARIGQPTLVRLITESERPEFASAVLRLAGRAGRSAAGSWRMALVEPSLNARSPELREAAVEAIEQWEDQALVPLLRDHDEPVAWLRAYIEGVIDDLSE